MFKPDNMPIFDAVPEAAENVRAWDLASSLKGDWTVGLKLARPRNWQQHKGLLVVTDIRRMRGTPDQVRHAVLSTAESDGRRTKIWLPQDPAQAGADQAASYVQMLHGFRVEAERMSGDKVTRADAAASQANIGNWACCAPAGTRRSSMSWRASLPASTTIRSTRCPWRSVSCPAGCRKWNAGSR